LHGIASTRFGRLIEASQSRNGTHSKQKGPRPGPTEGSSEKTEQPIQALNGLWYVADATAKD